MQRFSLLFFLLIFSSSISYAENIDIIYHSPQPNAENCTRQETIIFSVFKEIDPNSIKSSLVTVTGSLSGLHSGNLILSTDKKTLIFKPDIPFSYLETVNVNIQTGLKTINNDIVNGRSFSFSIRKERTAGTFFDYQLLNSKIPQKEREYRLFKYNFTTDNNSVDPNTTVLNSTNPSYGRLFMNTSRFDPLPFSPSVTIFNNNGSVKYSIPVDAPSLDFKKHKNGKFSYFSMLSNTFILMDESFTIIDTITCGNGYTTDLHELLFTDEGNMFLMGYDTLEIDMSQIVTDGHPNAQVAGLVIQELDKNKDVIYQWRSWEEMEITDTDREDLTAERVDYVHGNSIELDWDGNFLISSRHLSEITKLDRQTGKIMWRMGGKRNQFRFINDNIGFSYQHDARRVAPGRITLFDNGNYHSPPYSRAVEYHIDEVNKTAALVWQFDHNKEIYGFAMGNAQRLSNGNTLIGWGAVQPNVTEVTPLGQIVFEMALDPGVFSYRAFKFPYDQPESQYPQSYVLNQNYPNPFNPSTVITFNIPQQAKVSIKVYDMLGREVSVLANNDFSAGEHYVQFNAENLSSGVYFYNLVSGSFSETKKMILLK